MNRFPRYAPSFQFYNPYRRNSFYTQYHQSPQKESPECQSNCIEKKKNNQNPRSSNKSISDDNFWFDLFGIKLYFDDVLILSLIFFLYKEEVKDEGLFLALVLLLIS